MRRNGSTSAAIHADDILAVIRERDWWKAGMGGWGRKEVCLAEALASAVLDRCGAHQRHREDCEEWVRWNAALRATARELFPGRVAAGQWPHVRFNDHPDTTLADVELVVKEAGARLRVP